MSDASLAMAIERGADAPSRGLTASIARLRYRAQQYGLAMLSPRPATIDLGTDQIGRWSVTRLVNRIARPAEPPIRMLFAPTLVVPPNGTTIAHPSVG